MQNLAPQAPPQYAYRWNGELQLDDDSALSVGRTTVLRGRRVCSSVLVKRIPGAAVDGASVDFNIGLSAAIEDAQRLQSGMIVSQRCWR